MKIRRFVKKRRRRAAKKLADALNALRSFKTIKVTATGVTVGLLLLAASANAEERRSLVPLYSTFAALQALDVHSTLSVLRTGNGREGNAAMAPLVGSPVPAIAVKALGAATVVALAERLRRTGHGRAAWITMAVIDAAYVGVVAHNYSLVRR